LRSYLPEPKDKDGRTPLSLAAGGGREAVIKLLLETGNVDVDSKDKGGRTPLAWAARDGHEAVVKLLLEKGVNMESKDQRGRTPLLWAARGHEAVVEMLLEKGVIADRLRSGNGLEIGEAKRSGSNIPTGLRGGREYANTVSCIVGD
jgi:ankyrin repeat protein